MAIPVGLYEVLSVAPAGDAPELRGFGIGTPRAGSEGDVYVLPITGWVVGASARVRAVEVVYHDRVLCTIPVRGRRDEASESYPDLPEDLDSGFHTLLGLVGLKLESDLLLRAVLEDEVRVPFASIAIRRRPLRTAFEPTIQPLILTSLERSGTTWLMKMFTSHPEIVVFRRFPYEYSAAKYWIHMLRVLSGPANLLESAHPDTFHAEMHWVGQNPFHDDSVYQRPVLESELGREYVERLASFCQQSIEDWYASLSRVQEQDAPRYFAEKVWPSYLPVLTWELYPKTKEVMLVRDFRDVASSMRVFDAGRSYSQFNRLGSASTDESTLDYLRLGVDALRNSWRTRGDRVHLVRYEDMVMRPAETLTGLLEYLEVDCSPPLVDQLLRQGAEDLPDLPGATTDPYLVEIHRTIDDPRNTIGRWRAELDDSQEAMYWEMFGEGLEEFGYTRSGDPE